MRLHLGALGTLGVIVSANFKVLPAARHESTLITAPQGISDAFASAGAAARGRLRPISIEIFKAGDGWITAARLEGRPSTVELGIAELCGAVAADRVVQADESWAWWREYLHGQRLTETGDGVVLRCGFPPKTSETAVSRIQTALVAYDISPEIWTVSPGLGAVVVGFDRPAGGSLKPVQDALLAHAENVSVLAAPSDLKSDIDVWGRRPETVHVMRALKAEFDPNNVLNPGRFVDRI
jgi:glycolate oxidase FAD binding subunit